MYSLFNPLVASVSLSFLCKLVFQNKQLILGTEIHVLYMYTHMVTKLHVYGSYRVQCVQQLMLSNQNKIVFVTHRGMFWPSLYNYLLFFYV